MRILHLFPDDRKFLGYAKNFFHLPEIENTWLIIGDVPNVNTVATEKIASYESISEVAASEDFERRLLSHDIWFVHYFDERLNPLVNQFASIRPLVIQLWGGDYVRFSNSVSQLLERETYKIAIHPHSKVKYLPLDIARAYHNLKWRLSAERAHYFNTLGKAKEVWTLLGSAENRLFTDYPNLNLVEKKVVYGDFSNSEIDSQSKKTKILLGNSANPTNNHLEALNYLLSVSKEFDKCYIPMSYGGTKEYVESVKLKMPSKIVTKTSLLLEFLPKESYHNLINDCDVFIMNHRRQQALGNILAGFVRGKTIYLNPKGVLWEYFTKLGFAVKSITCIGRDGIQKITIEQAIQNQKIVLREWALSPLETSNHLHRLLRK